MKHTLVVLVLVLATALPAQAIKRITPAVFPAHCTDAAGVELGYGIADHAGAALYATGAYTNLHLKQLLSMARYRGLTGAKLADAEASGTAAAVLGAPVGAYGTLKKTKSGWLLEMTVFDTRAGKQDPLSVKLPADAALAVKNGGVALAGAVAALDSIELASETVHPNSVSGEAMAAYLSCYAMLVRQPMGLRKSHVVDAATIAAARGKCETAVKADPAFAAAWAALSLASSLSMENERAAEALGKLRGETGYLPFAVLAEYWLATRFNSNAAGAVVLRDAARLHRGALIFLTYLGEHLNITKKYSEALTVWNRYLTGVNQSPYALSQKGYSMARLGFLDDAIVVSRQAVEQDPESMAVQLELASRMVDAKKLDDAAKILEPLAKDKRAWGEVVLRLGYVYLLKNDNKTAEKHFARALKLATAPSDWRTRGRTRYDLAIVMARGGKLKKAEDQLLAAAKEGFVVNSLLQKNPDLKKLEKRKRVTHLFKNPDLKLDPKLLQVSPFPTDAGGTVRPEATRPAAPGFSF